MQQININELKPHPRNNEFFDDMVGDDWTAFKESIRTSGVIEPVVVTQNMVIVSGHQRVRAAKELGINSIMTDIRKYDDEDKVLKDLIETNIRQRGIGNPNVVKLGRCIKELERIYGIQNGGNRGNQYKVADPKVSELANQESLANMIGISVDTLNNYKKLTELIPEIQDLVDTGIVAPSTAVAMVKTMTSEEQEEFVSSMDVTKKITKKEVQKYLDEIKVLKENPSTPEDYESTKKELQNYKKDYNSLRLQFDNKVSELQSLRRQIENMKNTETADPYSQKLTDSTLLFCSKVSTFIEQVGGYIWLTDEINKVPELEREGYIKSVHAIKSWADTMEYNINNKLKEIN